jgi:hypothetical protein
MFDIQTLQTISIAIASAGVFAAAIYYILQLRHQSKMRQTDLVIRLASDMRSMEVVGAFADVIGAEFKDYDDIVKKYGAPFSKNQVPLSLLMVGNYFEQLGVLFSNKLIDAHLIGQLFPISAAWEKMEPFVKGLRKEYQSQRYYEWFEYLYNEMKKREQRLQPTS